MVLTLPGLQLFPALTGERDFTGRGPVLFTPAVPMVITDQEPGVLQQVSLLNDTSLNILSSDLSTLHLEADVNTLVHVQTITQQHARYHQWLTMGMFAAGSGFIIFLIY